MTTHTNTHRAIHWLVGAAAAASVGTALFTGSATAFADDGVSNPDQQQSSGTVVVAPPSVADQSAHSNIVKKYDDTAKTIARNIRG
nr:hypothetical protein [Mycolicibacterium komanii]CRL76724.1 hypothetical protein CPGR_04582 [Mycolicibacterium komanii]